MKIIPLPKEKYDYHELHYSYVTEGHYRVTADGSRDEYRVSLVREKYDSPKAVSNIDTLYQEYWQNCEAYGVCGEDDDSILGYVEIASDEWNNTLRMTQLLVDTTKRGQGVGKFMVDFVKSVAVEREYRIILLEVQNYNLPAIDFYMSQGFGFCGGNMYFYSNTDLEDDEVMLEMAFLVE